MNIQKTVTLTASETALIDVYRSALGALPGNGDVISARDMLIRDLKARGLPTRRIESWHYTDLKALLRSVPKAVEPVKLDKMPALIAGSTVLSVNNGESGSAVAIANVNVGTFGMQLADGSAANRLVARGTDDAIGRINGILVRDGFVLSVADDAVVKAPIEVQLLHGAGQTHSRLPVTVGANAQLTLLERHLAVTGEPPALVSAVSDLAVGEAADVTWIILQQQGGEDTHLGQINVTLAANAHLTLYVINAGGKLVRQEIHIVAAGEGARLTLRGINLLGGDSHTDVTVTLGHNVPDTTSTQIVRNVVFDRAKGVFQGQIRVAPDAQQTDARMACNTLLLSEEAEFSTKPELEIFADDVQCAHGATVADIDKNHLFYLQARGIPENKARGLLVQAFVAEIVEEMEDEALVEALEQVIANWLEAHV
jgi:Fe-S cluster assembly protein SufD